MALNGNASSTSSNEHKIALRADNHEVHDVKKEQRDDMVRLERAQWLRAAVLGANDGLLSTTSLMLGVAAAKESKSAMMLSGLAGSLAGACSMAVGEYLSVSTQRDVEKKASGSVSKTSKQKLGGNGATTNLNQVVVMSPLDATPASTPVMRVIEEDKKMGKEVDELPRTLPNPVKAAFASASSFLLGSCVPLLSTMLVSSDGYRVVVVVMVTSLALALFGAVGARIGGSPMRVSALRVLIGGWIAMGVTYGLLKPFDDDDDKGEANRG